MHTSLWHDPPATRYGPVLRGGSDVRRAAAPIGFVLVLYAGIVQAATFSVGSAGTCTHATLASAIAAAAANGPNLDEIRIGNAKP